jgi:hypothetical protein
MVTDSRQKDNGNRRELQEATSSDETNDATHAERSVPMPITLTHQIYATSSCAAIQARILQELNYIQDQVSPACRVLLWDGPPKCTCYNDQRV